jgi:integral membrane protein
MTRDVRFLKFLRTFSFVEGVSTLVLFFVAMPLKYLFELPLAVTIVGSLHGLLFVVLVGLFFVALEKVPLSIGLMCAGIFGAVVPFGPFVVDRWLRKLDPAHP